MAGIRSVMAAGFQVEQAKAINGMNDAKTGITAAGTAITDAAALTASVNLVTTTASGTGVLLPDVEVGSKIMVGNGGANTLLVYPPTSAGKINNAAAGAAASLATLKGAIFQRLSATDWVSAGA